jgi:hypothetical protein
MTKKLSVAAPPWPPGSSESVRRRIRCLIWKVRCENRIVSRYLFNAGPVLRFRLRRASLNDAAVRAARELQHHGVVSTDVAALVSDSSLIAAAFDRAAALADDWDRSEGSTTSAKSFLHQLLGPRPVVDAGDPFVALGLHPQIRGVAEHYAGMALRLQDVNVWLTLPSESAAEHSQRWHRDLPEDHDILKCFLYVRDVTAGSGPLEYARGSNARARRRERWGTEYDGIGFRISDREIAARIPAEEIVTAVGRAGTAVFCDTRGLHRGGLARSDERLVIQITWSSAATTRPRNLVPAGGRGRRDLRGVRVVRQAESR